MVKAKSRTYDDAFTIPIEEVSEAAAHPFLSVVYQVEAKEDEEDSYRCAAKDRETSLKHKLAEG